MGQTRFRKEVAQIVLTVLAVLGRVEIGKAPEMQAARQGLALVDEAQSVVVARIGVVDSGERRIGGAAARG